MKQTINWQRLYTLFTAPITDFDCGALCAVANRGVPPCCDVERHVPVLFTGEFKWLSKKSRMWPKNRVLRSPHHELMYCACTGVRACNRKHRSLACRFFPFEPYLDEQGRFTGATWMYSATENCPLVDSKKVRINQEFIDQFMRVWTRLFLEFHKEYEFYKAESWKLREKFSQTGKQIQIFKRTVKKHG